MVCILSHSHKPLSGIKVGEYVNITSREGMPPNDREDKGLLLELLGKVSSWQPMFDPLFILWEVSWNITSPQA